MCLTPTINGYLRKKGRVGRKGRKTNMDKGKKKSLDDFN